MDDGRGAAGHRAVPRPVSRAVLGALLAVVAATGCSSTRDLSQDQLLGQGQQVRELRPGALQDTLGRRGSADDAEVAADRAEALLAAGDPAGALETVRQALLDVPPVAQADRLREIRLRARREFTRTALARGEAVPERGLGTEGEEFRVEIRLRNLAPVPLVLERPAGGLSPTLARVAVSRIAYDIFGNVRTDSWEESHPIVPGEAAPGATLGVVLTIDTGQFRETRPHGFVEYRFGGTILPSAVRLGDLELHERVPIDEARVRTFPQRGWEEVAAAPGEHLDRGIREGNPVRVLVAAGCVARGNEASTGADLVRRLHEGGEMKPGVEAAVRAALRVLGGDIEADGWSEDRWEARAAAKAEGDR